MKEGRFSEKVNKCICYGAISVQCSRVLESSRRAGRR